MSQTVATNAATGLPGMRTNAAGRVGGVLPALRRLRAKQNRGPTEMDPECKQAEYVAACDKCGKSSVITLEEAKRIISQWPEWKRIALFDAFGCK